MRGPYTRVRTVSIKGRASVARMPTSKTLARKAPIDSEFRMGSVVLRRKYIDPTSMTFSGSSSNTMWTSVWM